MNEALDKYGKIIFRHFGEEKQLDKLNKECIEFVHAINRCNENKNDITEVYEEIGDIYFLIKQLFENNTSMKDFCINLITQKAMNRVEKIEKGEYGG